MTLSRRQVLQLGGATAAASVLASGSGWAFTGDGTASFGYTVGSVKGAVVSDGNLSLPVAMLARDQAEAELVTLLEAAGMPGDANRPPVNVTLLDFDGKLVMVDAGSGQNFMPTAGKLPATLDALGVDPADVVSVVITHAHPDHVWGLIDDFEEAPFFPNANYFINAAEYDFWTADDVLSKVPDSQQGFAVGAQKSLKPVAERTTFFKPGDEIMPGLTAIGSEGHTPGHCSFRLDSGSDSLLISGDAFTHKIISFEHPNWRPGTDILPDLAVTTRRRILDMAAKDKLKVIGYHLPFPGLGRVEAKGDAWRWAPDA